MPLIVIFLLWVLHETVTGLHPRCTNSSWVMFPFGAFCCDIVMCPGFIADCDGLIWPASRMAPGDLAYLRFGSPGLPCMIMAYLPTPPLFDFIAIPFA